MDVIPLNNVDSFFKFQDHTIFLRLESLTKKLVFHNLSYILKHRQDTYFLYLAYKALRAVDTFFFSRFFQSSFSGEKFILSQVYLFIYYFHYRLNFFYFFINATFTEQRWYFLLMESIVAFLLFYSIREIYVWSTLIQIHFMTFIMQ